MGSTPPPASDLSRGAEVGSTAQALPTTNVSEYGLGPLPSGSALTPTVHPSPGGRGSLCSDLGPQWDSVSSQ